MNQTVIDFLKEQIKEGLKRLPDGHQLVFKRLYAHGNLDKDINSVVDDMPVDKLDWALSQVQNSLKKIKGLTA